MANRLSDLRQEIMPLHHGGGREREDARLALHCATGGDEESLREVIDMLGLYVNRADMDAGFSRIGVIVDGKVRTRHAEGLPPGRPPRPI